MNGSFKVRYEHLVITEIQPHVAITLKRVMRQIRASAVVPISVGLTPAVAEDFEWFMQRYPMEGPVEEIARMAEKSREIGRQIEQAISGDVSQVDVKLSGVTLRDYQIRGVSALWAGKRMLIGDDVGLGKTYVGLGMLSRKEARPALIVVQAHLIKQWEENVRRVFPALRTYVIRTTNPKKEYLKQADVYITTYHRISKWVNHFHSGRAKSVEFDEVQELRNPGSEKYKAAKNIADAMEYVVGLTATPVYNYGQEMHAIMDVIQPGCLAGKDEFTREWCDGNGRGIVKDPKALGTFLRSRKAFLRRTRSEVGRELPMENRIVHTVPYDQAEHDRIEDMAMKLATTVMTGSFEAQGQAARELDLMLRMATGVAKAKYVAEYVKILLENGERVLLAGWHRDVYDIWLRELKDWSPSMYTGSESGAGKHRSKEDFVVGKSRVMIMSLRSGAGLDGLQGICRTVVFGELDWSPEVHKQVIGRLRRDRNDGQKEQQVDAIFLVSDGGSDPVMVDILGLKAEQAQGINDPTAGVTQIVADSGRIKQMAQRFLDRRSGQLPMGSVL